MPNFAYHLARAEGVSCAECIARFCRKSFGERSSPPESVPFEVFAYSGHEICRSRSLRSARSCVTPEGQSDSPSFPMELTTDQDIDLLREIDPSVSVEALPPIPPDFLRVSFLSRESSTGKQLGLIMSLPRWAGALCRFRCLFFSQGARSCHAGAMRPRGSAFYLADCQFSGDARLVRLPNERKQPVNTGVLLLLQKLDWSLGIRPVFQS